MKKTTIAEIIDGMGLNKYIWGIVFLIGMGNMLSGVMNRIPSYTMPQISQDWGLTGVETGMISSYGGFGLLFGSFLAGLITDRVGRKKGMALGILMYSAFTLLVGLSPNFTMLAIFRIATGFAIGFYTPITVTMLSEFSPSKNRGLFVALSLATYVFGFIVIGFVSTLTMNIIGWRNLYILGGIVGIAYILIVYRFIPESPRWLLSKQRGQEAVNWLKSMEIKVKGKAGDYDADSIVMPALPTKQKVGVKRILTGKYLTLALTIWTLNLMSVFTVYGMQQWMPSLLVRQGYSVIKSYGFATMLDVAGIFGVLCTGILADKIGRKKNGVVAFGILALCELVVGFTTANPAIILTAIVVIGFTMNWAAGSIQPVYTESWPNEVRATGVGWTQAIGRVGSILAPILVGYLVQIGLSFNAILACFAVPAIIAVIIMASFRFDAKGKTLEQIEEEVAGSKKSATA